MMSCDGTMIGLPFAGDRMLLVDIMRTRASICASTESGTCTAIWSPSKSALNAVQTSGCSWIALPSIRTGSNAWMLVDDLVEDVPHLVGFALDHPFCALDGRDQPARLELVVDERLEQLQRH